jgi:hypothetical protein
VEQIAECLFVSFVPLRNKQGSQGFARRVGIKRELKLYCLFLKSGIGVRSPEIVAREGPHFTCRRARPAQRPSTGLPARPVRHIAAYVAAPTPQRRHDLQASFSGTAAAGSATPTYRYSRVGNGQVDGGGGRGR